MQQALKPLHVALVGGLLVLALASCGTQGGGGGSSIVCPPNLPYCLDGEGKQVYPDGDPYTSGGTGDDGDTGGDDDGGGDAGDGDTGPAPGCTCTPSPTDQDGDCIPDSLETVSDPTKLDTDGDGINDGCEDRNRNGIVNTGETNPANADTDGDGIPDGVEDANQNGRYDNGETSPIRSDTDGDGIADGLEDRNGNGIVDPWVDVNGNGCYDPGVDTPGESDPSSGDTDGDLLRDNVEDKNQNGLCDSGETCAFVDDTDCDKLIDGKEDLDHNGTVNSLETDPLDPDTDGDGILDGIEDANGNGVFDVGNETSPRLVDSDGDGIRDDKEDLNRNGVVDAWVDTNGNGCYDPGVDTPGESNPRSMDSDGDGIRDDDEDLNRDGLCGAEQVPDPLNPGQTRLGFLETCAYIADTDCDGLSDGQEDVNRNGARDIGELDARYPDSDYDGLTDGCPAGAALDTCEDKNNNAVVDPGETDPRNIDSDFDYLSDGCELRFEGGATNPLLEDTDGDGTIDGEEDANHNCRVDGGESDPRQTNPTPPEQTEDRARWNVCASQNLKQLTFAESARATHDYRVAFEVESDETRGEARYVVRAFGKDNNGGGLGVDDPADELWGQIFQSPAGVVTDEATSQVVNRDIYGFVLATEDASALDDLLDGVRANLETLFPGTQELGALTARPAHDDGPNFRIYRAQRQFALTATSATSAIQMRNTLLRNGFLSEDPQPADIMSNVDPAYGALVCPGSTQCYQSFTLYIAGVQRLDQDGPGGLPVTLLVVALTPNTADPANPTSAQNRLYADRVTRLEDLTGGSAVARFEARRSSTCERKLPKQAKADLLWVVDDSRSMQQVIDRLQQAARDAKAVLTANAEIVDFRVSMTTTNPSQNARKFCPDVCDATCATTTYCQQCADQWLDCVKLCPPGCTSACTSGCASGNDVCTPGCVEAAGIAGALTADLGTYGLPGGGGTFYYEDSHYLDCDSRPDSGAVSVTGFTNPCNGSTFYSEFAPFYGTGGARKALTANAGFLGSDASATCTTALMDLTYKADAAGSSCTAGSTFCCERLTEACADGPTVLASQMCDLIRAMGGKPDSAGTSSGARAHSAPESGTRSARRLIEKMLPALPLNYSGALVAKEHLRLDCSTTGSGDACNLDSDCGKFDYCENGFCAPTGNCPANGCDPRTPIAGASGNGCPNGLDNECGRGERCDGAGQCVVDCAPVPLVTLFLSDEEDFYFKDECATSLSLRPGSALAGWQRMAAQEADKVQLPSLCRYRDGDPSTEEPCYDDPTDPLAYCSQFDTAWPQGYDPDDAPYLLPTEGGGPSDYSMKWRDASAAECSPATSASATSCVGDPCRTLSAGDCTTQPMCQLFGGECYNKCTLYTFPPESGNPYGSANTSTGRAAQRAACEADAECRWDQAMVTASSQVSACAPRYPLNDCQPCKRLRRRVEAVSGGDGLVGFGDVGPVYSIVRNRGAQGVGGYGDSSTYTQDECAGGGVTWGRGDGSAYRDIAIDTLGRTQNVCSDSYQDFMQLLVTDIVALSAPYPLAGYPIASTIKVGIARPDGSGGYTYEEVPRSRTSGFVYDGTSNSIGFKSDPIDGACGSASCAQNGEIEKTEIDYARTAPHVPKDGDIIYVSYRYWRPVPCNEQCGDGEMCVRTICTEEDVPPTCPGGQDSECTGGRICVNNLCVFDCTPGDTLDRCVPSPCGECYDYNPVTHTCIPITDTCLCNPSGADICDPMAPGSCPVGTICDETCVCVRTQGCEGGFDAQGNVINCSLAKQCCDERALAQTQCPALPENSCSGSCIWDPLSSSCQARYPACCLPSETAECAVVPETGEQILYCDPGVCTCDGAACADDSECNTAAGEKCVAGVCTCNPVTHTCCIDCGGITGNCMCQQNPG